MPDGLTLGVGGLNAQLGDHICGLYSGEVPRDHITFPFLEAGLASGEKCIYVVDGTDPARIVATLVRQSGEGRRLALMVRSCHAPLGVV
jgi:hypothetical protein